MQHAYLRQQSLPQLKQVFHALYDFEAGGDDCGEEAKDVLGIVGAVGVIDDAPVSHDVVLADYLLKGEAVVEIIRP